MLPTGVLARRVVRSHGIVVVTGIRWFRKCTASGHRSASETHRRCCYASAGAGHPRPTIGRNVVHLSANYCSTSQYGVKKVVPFVLADIGEGISEVTIKDWYVNVGDRVAEFDDVCEVESDKATVTITSRYAGVVIKRHYESGHTARVGTALVDIEVDGDGETVIEQIVEKKNEVESSGPITIVDCALDEDLGVDALAGNSGKVLTTPAVRRIAAEKGIDLATVPGTGKHGRVLKEDLLDPEISAPAVAASSPLTSTVLPDFIPLTGYAKTMKNTMETSNKIPTMVITDEVNLTRLMELRGQLLPHAKLTILPFLVKATSLALTLHPRVNSTIGPNLGSYRPNKSHNIGVAIDTPLGLAVPNVKDVQTLTVVEIANRLAELRAKAEKGKLGMADVTGGTFTLSNMGSIAGSSTRPLILPPEVVICALGRIKYRPRYDVHGQLVRTPVMDTSWAADHRILDGAMVAKFFRDWQTYVENPSLILAGADLTPSEQ